MTQRDRSQSQERFSACGEASIWTRTHRPRQTCFYGFRIELNVKIKLIPRRPRFNSFGFIFTHRTHHKKREHLRWNYLYLFTRKFPPSGSVYSLRCAGGHDSGGEGATGINNSWSGKMEEAAGMKTRSLWLENWVVPADGVFCQYFHCSGALACQAPFYC